MKNSELFLLKFPILTHVQNSYNVRKNSISTRFFFQSKKLLDSHIGYIDFNENFKFFTHLKAKLAKLRSD